MALSTVLFSLICVVTFLFARMHGSTDYRNFFRNLVGPFWVLYEAAYMFSFVLVLAVYGAAAGAIGVAMFGWPPLAGVLCLIASIAVFTMFGNPSVEWLFKYASFFLYGVYALFVFFTLQPIRRRGRAGPCRASRRRRLGDAPESPTPATTSSPPW